MTTPQAFSNVWDALSDTPEEAANMHLRADLMHQVTDLVRAQGWTQAEAAARCAISQPRMNDLLRGRISCFSLDALVNIATALGRRVQIRMAVA